MQDKSKQPGLMSNATLVRGQYLVSHGYQRIEKYLALTRLNRPIGIFLLLWPALWAIWLASKGKPDFVVPVVFIFGVVLMRSAGCVINDYADRNVDGKVKRTQERPLATGRVSPYAAIVLFAVLASLAFMLVLAFLSYKVMLLSFIAVGLAIIYPFMKRITHIPQVILGMAFAMSIPMVYVQYTNKIPFEAWILFVGTVLWTTLYDTMYALVDKEDDVKIGVKSSAILFGDHYRIIIGIMQIIVMLSLLLVADRAEIDFGAFYAGLAMVAVLFGYQLFLVHDGKTSWCFKAFLNNNWVGAFVFLGLFFHYLIKDHGLISWHVIFWASHFGSIIFVYNLSMANKSNRAFWVMAAFILGPLAIPLVLFARRRMH